MLEQEEHGLMDDLVVDYMIVIQHENEFSARLSELIEQVCQDGREQGSFWRVQHLESHLPHPGQAGTQCGNDRGPEADLVIVQRLKRERKTWRSELAREQRSPLLGRWRCRLAGKRRWRGVACEHLRCLL